MVTVLLAVDETHESEHAARCAHELFGSEATYLAVNVAQGFIRWYPTPTVWGGVYPYAAPYPLVDDDMHVQADAENAESIAADTAARADVDAEPVGLTGDPVTAILQAAREHDVDVIVVGASEKSWWRTLFEGSVSTDVAKRAPQPVLLVHSD